MSQAAVTASLRAMTARDILLFQFGQAGAIRNVVTSRLGPLVGVALVLLTACARNYDQSFITDAPMRWLFGSLGFSLVSGTWLFLVTYGMCAWRFLLRNQGPHPGVFAAWPGFMAAYWLTAPIAWLYAIPVECWLASMPAARANLWLLGIVSCWRVLLMARVLQVVCRVPFARTLLWVLLAASVEVVALDYFSGGFSQRIMASMGGLRNSPEQELLQGALRTTATLAFGTFIIAVLLLLVWRWPGAAERFPKREPGPAPWRFLTLATVCWTAVAVPAQLKLYRNYEVETPIARGEFRQALDAMKRHRPEEFAPARPLPPKLYEWQTTKNLGDLMARLRADDPAWMHEHFQHSAAAVVHAMLPRGIEWDLKRPLTERELRQAWLHLGDTESWLAILRGLDQSAVGRQWRDDQPVFWAFLLGQTEATRPVGPELIRLLEQLGIRPLSTPE